MNRNTVLVLACMLVVIVYFATDASYVSKQLGDEKLKRLNAENALKTYQRANGNIPNKKNMDAEKKLVLTVCAELPCPPSVLYAIGLHEWGVPYMEYGMHSYYGKWDAVDGQARSRAVWLQKVAADWIEADTDRRDAFIKYCAKRNGCPKVEGWLIGVRHYIKKYDEVQ